MYPKRVNLCIRRASLLYRVGCAAGKVDRRLIIQNTMLASCVSLGRVQRIQPRRKARFSFPFPYIIQYVVVVLLVGAPVPLRRFLTDGFRVS